VTGERRVRILALLGADLNGVHQSPRLCDVGAAVTNLTGAGIMLMSGDTPRGSICSSNAVSALIEELQFSFGEGPCVDAYHQDQVVLEPDLAAPEVARWLAFTTPALTAGVRAVFGFPLRVGAIRLGALNLYRDRPGSLTSDQHADALVMANVAAEAVLIMQAGAPDGRLAHELETDGSFANVVHQASGMIAVQLDVTLRIALIRLRSYAFGNELQLAAVARDVVDRRLRFTDQGETDEPS
jgi:GAF domain-containing protein